MDKYGEISGTGTVLHEKKAERKERKKKGRLAMVARLFVKLLSGT
jgi:hypothetical protein